MKCHILFSEKNKKNISKCRLLKILPRVLSVNIPCTSEHEIPSLSAITLTVVLLSMLTMSLTKSLMEQVMNAR